MTRLWRWILGAVAAVIAAVAVIVGVLGFRRRARTLADDAVDLAKRELDREREAAERDVDAAIAEHASGFASTELELLEEVEAEALAGDLADAVDALRGDGGGATDAPAPGAETDPDPT